MDLAASRVCLSASGLDMSGLDAPTLTTTAVPAPASITAEPGAILPSLIRASMPARVRTRTSAVSPDSLDQLCGKAIGDCELVPACFLELWRQLLQNALEGDRAVNLNVGCSCRHDLHQQSHRCDPHADDVPAHENLSLSS